MARGRGVIGRDEEFAAIGELLGKPVPIVLRGPHGAGKTALLDEVASACRDRGIKAVAVELTSVRDWDLFGARDVLRALRAGFTDIGSSRLATALDLVNQAGTPAGYESAASRGRLLHQLQRLFDSFHGPTPSVVLFDDVDADPATVVTAASCALRVGCTVVVACDEETVALELTSFTEATGHVIELGPLDEAQVGELIATATRQQPDPAVAPAIRAALGSLAGNPGAVLALCERLTNQHRLIHLGGALCLADPDAPIALPADHWLVRFVERTHEFGPELVAFIADSTWFGMDDLVVFAAIVGNELGGCGRAVDEFTAIGALHCAPDGALTVACPALGAAAVASIGADRLGALHMAFAQHLVSRNHSLGHVLFPLADHLASAGTVDVGELDAAALLTRAARRIRPVHATLAARWQRAALARSDPSGDSRLFTDLLRELVRIGRYDSLAEVIADATTPSGELSAAACLAALHTGTPSPFTGRTYDADELARALAPLGGTHDRLTAPHKSGWFDPIGMIESVLGSVYGAPDRGPLVLCRNIVDAYRLGRWDEALSGARTLIATYRTDSPVHELARLLAAEICVRRSEFDLAEIWLAEVDRPGAFPTLSGWVEMSLPWRRGDTNATLDHGWQSYTNAVRAAESGNTVGLHLLLIRHALLVSAFGDGQGLTEIQETATAWCGRHNEPEVGVAELLVTALAQNSFPAARTAVAALRAKGHQTELVSACLVAAHTADDPSPWLATADEITEQLGDTWLRNVIRSLTRTQGVTLPRRTTGSRATSGVETRIVELVKQGMTNRQIAAAIQISEKSVERHLTKLFAKTGCRSRLDLAAHERSNPPPAP